MPTGEAPEGVVVVEVLRGKNMWRVPETTGRRQEEVQACRGGQIGRWGERMENLGRTWPGVSTEKIYSMREIGESGTAYKLSSFAHRVDSA